MPEESISFSNRALPIFLKIDLAMEIERRRELLHLLIHPPNGHSFSDWDRPKPGVRDFFQVSRVGGAVFPGTFMGSWMGSRAAKTETCTVV